MTETQHQKAVIKWSQQPEIRGKWPELKLLNHTANERKCTPVQGKHLKDMGVRAGIPDLDLPVARGGYHGLRIEMKTATGTESPEQVWWREELTKQGYFATVCHGYEAAIRTLEWYLNLKG